MFLITDKPILQDKITVHMSAKPKFSNYFGIDLNNVKYVEKPETLILKKAYEGYSRIYFLSNNSNELIVSLCKLSQNDIINIPSKIDIDVSQNNILSLGGYSLYETYVRLYNNENRTRGKFIENFATVPDVPIMYDILYSNFVPFTDHLPSKAELIDMVNNKQIFVNRNDNKEVTGLLGVEFEKTKCYMSFLIDIAAHGNGLFLLFNFFNYMGIRNITRSYLWVNCRNDNVLKLYERLGYKYDGLKDYTFVKSEIFTPPPPPTIAT